MTVGTGIIGVGNHLQDMDKERNISLRPQKHYCFQKDFFIFPARHKRYAVP